MTILENLDEENINKIKDFIKKYDDKRNEFEISFFQNSSLLTLSRFNNLISVLDIITKKNEEKFLMKKTTDLDIIFSLKEDTKNFINYRITISKLEKINEYMEMLHDRKNHLVFSILLKFIMENKNNASELKIIKKIKNVENYITIEDFYMKLKLDEELTLTKQELTSLSDIKKNYPKDINNIVYRYKSRTSYYLLKNKNVFQIDLTCVKQASTINDIEKSINRYEIEMECLITDKKTAIGDIFGVSEFIIKIIQQTNDIVSNSKSNDIVNTYKDLMGTKKDITKLSGRQAVSLETSHVIDNLPNKYVITDKADGERNVLIIIKGQCYLISNNLIVKNIGISVDEKFNNSILDGEYIFLQKYNKYIYMVFDCIIVSNNDCRNEEKFMTRISLSNELIENINKSDFNYNDTKNLNVNNINEILKYHTEKLIDFYEDIEKTLKKTKLITIVRRKYFISCNGVYDNEIFTYSNMLWSLFENNPNLKCPYLLDGMIYQPSDQRYEIPGKYSDLKWKPAHHNSIDFYIEFEKDRATGKILTVYDNSIEMEDIGINKTYHICNLYVGNTKNNIESFVLFDRDTKYSQCYIALDEDNNIRSEDGKIINDKTVVEFYYNLEYDEPLNWRWKARNTRYDKTESVQKNKKQYGNSYLTARKIWNTIQNPVKITDFLELSDIKKYDHTIKQFREKIQKEVVIKGKEEYYQSKEKICIAFNQFHSWIKSQIIYTYINIYYNDIQYNTLDFGCGQGGDIEKFYYASVKLYVGIEPVRAEIYKTGGAISRLATMKKRHANFPPSFYIVSTATSLLNIEDQEKVIGRMNDEEKKTFNKFFGNKNSFIFDRVTSGFSLHYYLKDENSWLNFCSNINTHLREGGYIMFQTFNGNKIRELLKDVEKYPFYYDDNGEKKLIAEIKKGYSNDNKTPYGNTIDVYMSWISNPDVYISEFLVDPDFIIKSLLENCNMELIERDDFENLYDNYEPYLKNIKLNDKSNPFGNVPFAEKAYAFYTDTPLNKIFRQYSFLSCYYVFKKKETNLEDIKKKYYNRVSKIYSDTKKK
jgi:hypothetical protein